MESMKFNKKIFSMLLERAKGERSWRQFALDCDVSYVQMRKLSAGTQENPPRPKLIKKLASNSFNDIDLEDYMFATGLNYPSGDGSRSAENACILCEKYKSLSAKQKKAAVDFIDFLVEKHPIE